jgi:GNAT superfamily N-acetyltransferase
MLHKPKRIIVCEKSEERRRFVQAHYPEVLLTTPEECKEFVLKHSEHRGADRVLEVAGADDTFRLAWECARPNAIVTVVALYDQPQVLPLPDMYGKNLTFKTGGVDGCDCEEVLRLIEAGKIDTTPLITHRFPLSEIEEAYRIFENKLDGVIKVAVEPIALHNIENRVAELIAQLTELWEASVRATHHFLTEDDICEIRSFVPMAISNVSHLVIATDAHHSPVAFMGVENDVLEMLFVSPSYIGVGIGRRLVQYVIDHFNIKEVTVNEQNPSAVGFYEHIGFKSYKRTDCDEQGRPFPLIYMRL